MIQQKNDTQFSNCYYCNNILRDTAKFCNKCGRSVDKVGIGSNVHGSSVISEDNSTNRIFNDPENLEDTKESFEQILIKNRFLLQERIFTDNHGSVYSAFDQKRERLVVVKEDFVYPLDEELFVIAQDRFLQEGKILSSLKNKFIPRVIDAFIESSRYYVIMKHVEGKSLDEIIKNTPAKKTGIPIQNAYKIILSLCELVEFLHNNKPQIIHRNIKPSKVMINTLKKVILLPWVCRPAKQGALTGTKGFAAPEQYRGEFDQRSDIYGIASTFYYLLTGKDPKKEAPFHFIPLSILRPDLSGSLDLIINKSLQIDPQNRYKSISQLKKVLLDDAKKYFS